MHIRHGDKQQKKKITCRCLELKATIKQQPGRWNKQNDLNGDRQHDSSTLAEEQRRTSWRFQCLLRQGVWRRWISETPLLLATQMGDVKTVFAEVFSRCLETAWSKWLQEKWIFQELEHMGKNHMILGRCFQACLSERAEDCRPANLPENSAIKPASSARNRVNLLSDSQALFCLGWIWPLRNSNWNPTQSQAMLLSTGSFHTAVLKAEN